MVIFVEVFIWTMRAMTHEEVVEKMRKGMHMLIRESYVHISWKKYIKAVTEVNPAFARRVSFCTDDVIASDILERDILTTWYVWRSKAGVEPMTAIQMATINSAEAYRIDDQIGPFVRTYRRYPVRKKALKNLKYAKS